MLTWYDKNKMTHKKINPIPYIILMVSLLILLSLRKSDDKTIFYEEEPILVDVKSEGKKEFSFKEFKRYVVDIGIKFPEIVLAQAIQESGMSSKIWEENNNPFGMKVAKSRNTTSIGTNRGHAKFKNWKMAVIDYAYMQAIFARKVKTRDQYFIYLKGYAEDENYDKKLKAIIRKYKGFGLSDDYLDDL